MSALGQRRTCAVHWAMSAWCQFQPRATLRSYTLPYMRELPTERAIVPRNELAAYVVGCWLSRHRDLTLDQRKRGHAFQPGMAW